MLNELRELAVCIKKANIDVEDLHPNFKACPNYLTYWAYIDTEGNITGISQVSSKQVPTIRKWEKANGVSFPAFNMPPLFKAESEEMQEKIKGLRKSIEKGISVTAEELYDTVNSCKILWDDGIIKKLTDCLSKPIADISGHLKNAQDTYKSVVQLISRAQLVKAPTFKEQITGMFLQCVHDSPSTDLLDALFFYSGKTPKNFQIILELADRDRFEYPANHQEVQRWMNRQFLTHGRKDTRSDLDAFGCDATGKDSKFPSIGFKNALGNVILRAMNYESPCQYRYGMIDYHSFPAGEEVRKEIKGALEWLGNEERKGKTWCDLSRRMERPMLLFAYPSVIPHDLPDLAGMMGEAEDEEMETDKELFSALAEKVTIALRGRTKETIDTEIRVFVLAKMDKARTKVLASSRYSVEHVIRSAELWQEACRNIPAIAIHCFGKAKGETHMAEPLVPFPAEVVWCLNTVWMRQGTQASGTQGFTVNDSLCLLLGSGHELQQVSERALGVLVRNSTTLLVALGQADTQGLVHKTDKKFAKQTLLLPSIIGLLLHKLGHTKGEIMTSPAFLVGRLLSFADQLHLEYCKQVRKNSIPPQLIGNALMATALEEPFKALAMLSQRILPYQAWAQTLTEGERFGLVKSFLKQLGKVSDELTNSQLPQRCSDAEKAQLLLGYLARPETEKTENR